MTPKEKAQELLDKIINIENKHDCFGNEYPLAKDCALIAVNEIINTIEFSSQVDELSKTNYWQEVKQEIEKL